MRDVTAPILLPELDGPGIPLRPCLAVWEEVEARHGDAGLLWERFQRFHFSVRMCHDLLYKAARAAGHQEEYAVFGVRLDKLGARRFLPVVNECFDALFKNDAVPASASAEGPTAPLV